MSTRGLLLCILLNVSFTPVHPDKQAGPLSVGTLAFVDINLVPMDSERVLPHQTVVVRGRQIAAIGPVAAIVVPPGAVRVEGHGSRFLMPGLADMHTHADEPDDFYLYVANGVTTILNMGGESVAKSLRPHIEAGEITGPHIFSSFFMDGPDNDPPFVFTAQNAREGVRRAKADGYEFIKVYNSLSREAFYEIIDEAHRQGLAVVGHGVRSVGLEEGLRAGQIMVAHGEEYIYAYFHNREDRQMIPAAVRTTREMRAYVTPNLSAYNVIAEQWGKPAVSLAFLERPEAKYLRPDLRAQWARSDYVRRAGSLGTKPKFLADLTLAFSDAGVPLLLGTDSPSIPGMFPGFSAHDDLDRLVQAGLTPYQALSAGTRTPGEFIRRTVPTWTQEFGTVTIGKRADLVLLASNPLENVSNARHPLGVMLNGAWFPDEKIQIGLNALRRKNSDGPHFLPRN